jgi:selenide,water dikinase
MAGAMRPVVLLMLLASVLFVVDGVLDGVYPGGLKSNREYLENRVTADGVGQDELLPLYDPQTSGGLLVALPEERAPALVRALEGRGTLAAVVGEVVEDQMIRVIP